MTRLALALAVLAAPAAAQPSAALLDLAPDFAAAIAGALPAPTIRLNLTSDDARVRPEMIRLLAARGVRVVEIGDAIIVEATCGQNLRERVCAARIVRDGATPLVVTTRPRDAKDATAPEAVVGIELQPIYTQRGAILDAVAIGSQRVVLTPTAVLLVSDAGRVLATQPIKTARVWPRDLRGMLHAGSPTSFDAHLPGVTCRGTIAPTFAVSCADEAEPWPLALDNAGIAPSRNTFATPEGLTFYEAAAIAGGRWIVVGDQGVLMFLDARRRADARADSSDHVAGLPDACGGDTGYVMTVARTPDAPTEALRLSRVVGDRLVPTASTLVLPGVLTSLWTVPAARAATAVTYDAAARRYEAFEISLSCAR
jgi:hypothetical protein